MNIDRRMKGNILMIQCKTCICNIICRLKSYCTLFNDCEIIREQIPFFDHVEARNQNALLSIYKNLRPVSWKLQFTQGDLQIDPHFYIYTKEFQKIYNSPSIMVSFEDNLEDLRYEYQILLNDRED